MKLSFYDSFINLCLSNFLVPNTNFQLFRSMAYHLLIMVMTTIWRRKRKSTLFGISLNKKSWRTVLDFTVETLISSNKLCTDGMFKTNQDLGKKQETSPKNSS